MVPKLTSRFSVGSAVAGAAIWLLLLFIPFGNSVETELIQRMLLLGVLVIVPLGLSLISVGGEGLALWSYSVALVLQPIGAAAVVASFFIDPGLLGAGLASAWLAVTLLVSLVGLSRLLRPDLRSAADFCTTAALLYLPVGAVWLTCSAHGGPLSFRRVRRSDSSWARRSETFACRLQAKYISHCRDRYYHRNTSSCGGYHLLAGPRACRSYRNFSRHDCALCSCCVMDRPGNSLASCSDSANHLLRGNLACHGIGDGLCLQHRL